MRPVALQELKQRGVGKHWSVEQQLSELDSIGPVKGWLKALHRGDDLWLEAEATANRITPVMITGMFLFFPLPAGVLLYMVVANIFQALQTFLLIREPLPDNLQTILDQQLANQTVAASATAVSAERLPFEPKGKR